MFKDTLFTNSSSSTNPKDSPPTLILKFEKPRIWLTHLVLRHYSHNTFNITGWKMVRPSEWLPRNASAYSKPSRNEEERFIIPIDLDPSIDGPAVATFAVHHDGVQLVPTPRLTTLPPSAEGAASPKVVGMGWRGLWGAGTGVHGPALDDTDVRASSEIWFEKE